MTKPALSERIREWMESQGYPLEMFVARELSSRGFTVLQADYQKDPETQQFREVDVVAMLPKLVGNTIYCCTLVIECKLSRDKPWVVFRELNAPGAAEFALTTRVASASARPLLVKMGQPTEGDWALFEIPSYVGYGVTQAFVGSNDRGDVAYNTCLAVAKAAKARAEQADLMEKNTGIRMVEVVLPVVVIDAPVFTAALDHEGSLQVEPAQEGVIMWRNPVAGTGVTILNIVPRERVPVFAVKAYDSLTTVLTAMILTPLDDNRSAQQGRSDEK